jgi:ubiquinone/menaquinone biosynthesis C-methylase UbiE
MIYSVQNISPSQRVFYDTGKREVKIDPGQMKLIDLDEGTYNHIAMRMDVIVRPASFERKPTQAIVPPKSVEFASLPPPPPPPPPLAVARPAMDIQGHFGIGDNLHQRAILRCLLPTHDVWLRTCHYLLYHDLVAQGLKLVMRDTSLHAQRKTIAREHELFDRAAFPPPPSNAARKNIGYPKVLIDQHGSILEAQFSCVGLKMPERPDFSLPVREEWMKAVRERIASWDMKGKPLMIHRPVVIRQEWDGRSRNPDVKAYDEIYRAIRDQFFVVSVADLEVSREWIDGPEQEVDVKLHKGELEFPELAALFRAARLIYCNAGFAPVLAQAVGTPQICVYGGRESFRTTQRIGVHLAPTCPIDVINPCDCHSAAHRCDKRIDVHAALGKAIGFASGLDKERTNSTLVFGTFYVDSPDRDQLTDLWRKLHVELNGDGCDFLAVDSASPIKKFDDWPRYDGQRHHFSYYNFPYNIGHLSRRRVTAGRDGWGRAFCQGLQIACDLGYEHVVHIEGDSLLRLRVKDIVDEMKRDGVDCMSTSVRGMRHADLEKQWVETGLMFFTTDYIRRSQFIKRYDWPNRRVAPTPERWVRLAILEKDLNDKQFKIMPWRAFRADKNQITVDNIASLDLDWVTHQHDSSQQGVYQKFVDMALGRAAIIPAVASASSAAAVPPIAAAQTQPGLGLQRYNLGCGTNKLAGWQNHDADVDVTKKLPWPDQSASHIVIEHCIEHVPYKAAIGFFQEAWRVLAPGGVLRVTVPSLEQIARCDDDSYFKFTTKWQPLGATRRGAMHAIIYAHGHECAWNSRLLQDTLYFAGFDDVQPVEPGKSNDPALVGVEGHGRVIGDKFNLIESCTCEARKAGRLQDAISGDAVAIIVGGGDRWKEELDEVLRLVGDRPVTYFYINDQIKSFDQPGYACTLHPDKLNGHFNWLAVRKKAGLSPPLEVWSHRKHGAVTHDTASAEWKGSSGLFAVQVARRKGFRKVIGCGVPMTVEGGHFERRQKWQSAIAFRQGWLTCRNEITPDFRSMSGWTADIFGRPTQEWLGQ